MALFSFPDMDIRDLIFDTNLSFEEKAGEVFAFQAEKNPVYQAFTDTFGYSSSKIPPIKKIPLLPVRGFREARISSSGKKAPLVFKSSGTTGMRRSVHEVHDPEIYRESICRGFEIFYPDKPVVIAYAPGYSENPESSLVWMMQTLIAADKDPLSGFIEPEAAGDIGRIEEIADSGRRVALFGAAFGLLDLSEKESYTLPESTIVIETGGMKTRRREVGRRELHEKLAAGFGLPVANIHSEYGMCELLSQAYAREDGWFKTVPWMQVTIRDPENPGRICNPGDEGLIGVIDLANLYSCSFILTGDRGVGDESGRFQVLGRWNPEDMRGCNFLVDRD